ncbi:MAG TPA: CHASE2 domain-containing protein, partial [Casimicrobiaceae bacterium]|nr:CHASE2 domain-containing protein [Casimicrobiaceae bacterium]
MSASVSSQRTSGAALAVAVVAAAVTLLGLLSLTPPWRDLERRTFDLATALVAPGRIEASIVIVAIDESSFAELRERWPFPRSMHATLINRIVQDGPLAIGFDVLFAEPSANPDDDKAFAASIRRAGNVVLAMARDPFMTVHARGVVEVRPLQAFIDAGALVGNVGLEPDPDFVVRRLPEGDDTFARVLAKRAGADVLPVDDERTALMRYAGPRGTVPAVHYYQAVEHGFLPSGFFRGKIVLVGLALSTSPEVTRVQADQYNAPFFGDAGAMPGVEIQAQALANLIERRPLVAVGPPAAELLALALASLVAWVGFRRGPLKAGAVLVLSLIAVPAAMLLLFMRAGLWLSWLLPVSAATVAFTAQTVQSALVARARVRETRLAFARYVPPELVKRIANDPESLALGGEERELTLLFSDLRNFTELAEGLPPQEVVRVLSDYFDAMTQVIH